MTDIVTRLLKDKKLYQNRTALTRPWLCADVAAERAVEYCRLLRREARRARRLRNKAEATALKMLAKKLERCVPKKRCGSLACPQCLRAIQHASADGFKCLAKTMKKSDPHRQLVMATIIPDGRFRRSVTDVAKLDFININRWFTDQLRRHGIRGPIVGAIDIQYVFTGFQLHWHVAIFTDDISKTRRLLKRAFPSFGPCSVPVKVVPAKNKKFLRYSTKLIKARQILRNSKRKLPALLLALDNNGSLDHLVLFGVRKCAHQGRFSVKPIASKKVDRRIEIYKKNSDFTHKNEHNYLKRREANFSYSKKRAHCALRILPIQVIG